MLLLPISNNWKSVFAERNCDNDYLSHFVAVQIHNQALLDASQATPQHRLPIKVHITSVIHDREAEKKIVISDFQYLQNAGILS